METTNDMFNEVHFQFSIVLSDFFRIILILVSLLTLDALTSERRLVLMFILFHFKSCNFHSVHLKNIYVINTLVLNQQINILYICGYVCVWKHLYKIRQHRKSILGRLCRILTSLCLFHRENTFVFRNTYRNKYYDCIFFFLLK